jgi:hypothetical protein
MERSKDMSPRIPETYSTSSVYCSTFLPSDEIPPRDPNDDDEDEDQDEDEDDEDQPQEPPIVREPDKDEP